MEGLSAYGCVVPEKVYARGRDAVLIDIGGGRLLRRFAGPRDLDREVAIMRLAQAAGMPVPEVYDVRADAMVIERIDGPTMLQDLVRRPWRVDRRARQLAGLHEQLHAIPAPESLRLAYGAGGRGDVLVHGDLHPANVVLGPAGPVVIDWTNAGRGVGAEDVADVWLVLAASRPDGRPAARILARGARRRILSVFLSALGDPVRAEAAALLTAIARHRAADSNVGESEKAAMARVAQRHGAG